MPVWTPAYRTHRGNNIGSPLSAPIQILTGNPYRISITFCVQGTSAMWFDTTSFVPGFNSCAMIILTSNQTLQLKRDVNQAMICDPWFIVLNASTGGYVVTEEFWIPPSGS